MGYNPEFMMMGKHPGSQLRQPLHRLHQCHHNVCQLREISRQVGCGDPGCWVIPIFFVVSGEKGTGCLVHIGDYTTQLQRDRNKPP